MLKLSKILEKLARSQEVFLRTADAIPAIQWNIFPKPGTWSAAEVVAHLITVETTILSTARKLQAKQPRKFPPWKRLHLPLLLVEMRVARRRTAMPSDPRLIRAKDSMLEELREVRERTVAFLEETKGRDLSVYLWPHPFLSGQPGRLPLALYDRRASGPARQANTGNPQQSSEKRIRFTKVGLFYLSCGTVFSFVPRA